MTFSIRTLLVTTIVAAIALAVWQHKEAHRRLWSEYTSNSIEKSQWKSRGWFYGWAIDNNGFTYLENTDPRFVDFRYWGDGGGCEKYFTIWRIPYTSKAMSEHVQAFGLLQQEITPEIIEVLESNLPKDCRFKTTDSLVVYQPKGHTEISYFARILIHDVENQMIIFYDMDQEIPA